MKWLLGTEITQPPCVSKGPSCTAIHSFQPFGWAPRKPGMASSYSGYTLEYGQIYLPGDGNRALNPAMLRFMQPDRLGPFGRGGLNVYAHCNADPVNCVDRDGYMPLRAWLRGMVVTGLAETITGLGMIHWGSRLIGDVGTGIAIQGVATTATALAALTSKRVFQGIERSVRQISNALPDWLVDTPPRRVGIELQQLA
ncbi:MULTISPECIES: RHS repeat-associated core domain-containing protein [unclassified Pseudomonas]|uniref:RHS repeat-associated core domain-containing protein n=1 Tax=unclassified Pseudomonas TaxID=196821 RepID=UPI000BCD4264|nr:MULTISPECIES: RHS repeat-associated core domain-containing protein [unclassified Pseudomonas]PVZ20338.1 RHS repeat-associated protein [Pseudomonas sp. URIL14HWK12:I12]PVZ27404.1 RHS repeat-associated protein [Pseudomonas sp. URIL14HWK12:I10]PVZ38293.1 RHS repeat-associated protein [Pseudomonas sp. URIL14HWK12:I11]SNZ03930.1 RHS repeat-associated core domain-containing protein [Pseudomonas sp. URIL14HWK12:I9]